MEEERCMTRYQLLEDYAAIIDEQRAKLKAWEACADRLFVWADEVRCGTTNQALYEAVKEDIIKYNRLKLNEPDA
jgi:hypothetical protein